MRKKIWIRLFVRISAIFAAFVAVLMIANGTMLYRYYEDSARRTIISAERSLRSLDLDSCTVDEVASALSVVEGQNFIIDIYDPDGRTVYTTMGNLLWDLHDQEGPEPKERRHRYKIIGEEKHGEYKFMNIVDNVSGSEYIMYNAALKNGYTATMRVQKLMMENSADIANRFLLVVAIICLGASIFWVIVFTKQFSKPISDMNVISRKMANLDFSEKLTPTSEDEIGQLAVSINELSEKLDETLLDLRKSNAQLRDEIELERRIDAMRKDFVANVSHELKTPISIIQGYAEGLKLGVCDNPESYCDTILEESIRMNRLVLDLLELSRYESGQISIDRCSFNVASLVLSLCRKLSVRSEEAGAEIVTDRCEDVFVFADPVHIEQVISNYLSNAISHVNRGGKITVEVTTENGLAVVRVENTGHHIAEEEMPMLWQSFYRSDKSHKRDSSRFGLGLSIVKSILELHGRECGVYNTEDGVCFWFNLDLAES